MRTAMTSLALAVVLALAGSAKAAPPTVTITWLENGQNTDLGVGPVSFTESGLTVSATAYSGVTGAGGSSLTSIGTPGNNGSSLTGSNDLYAKNQGGDEVGLGLTSDHTGDHEITYGFGILLDFSKVKLNQPYTIHFGSVTGSDTAAVYDATTKARVGSIITGDGMTITIGPGATDLTYLVTEATSGTSPNVLLGAVTLTAVPEPSAMAIAAVGAIGFIGYGLRRRKARTA